MLARCITPGFQAVGEGQPLQGLKGVAFRVVTVGYGSLGEYFNFCLSQIVYHALAQGTTDLIGL